MIAPEDPWAWRVHIDGQLLQPDTSRVRFYRHTPSGRTEVMLPGEQWPTITVLDEGAEFPAEAVWNWPTSALRAVAEHFNPGPGLGELARLQEALEVERNRVDLVLAERKHR